MIRKTLKIAAVTAALGLALSACGGGDGDAGETTTDAATTGDTTTDAGEDTGPIRIGVVGASDEQWPIFQAKAEEAGIEVEIVDFSEYTIPNPALTEGELDLNQFQHLQYLANYNVEADEDLTPIGATAVYPLGLYSTQYSSVDEIPEGSEVAVPNDPTNLSRALLVLQDAGLVTLVDGGTSFSTEIDVIADESKVSVTPVDAAQTAIALDSVAASVINNDFITDAGLTPEDALYQDDADSPGARPYINVWVARAEDKDNETFLKLVEIFHDPEVLEALQTASGGTAVIADQSGSELEGYLTEIEDNLKALG
ncbi:MAG: MetQ/NlpA family ABC transporter substrate-binding protein [Cellulomonadaceae bacterium]